MSTLPPLPEPHSTRKVWVDGIPSHLFTAEQMFAFRARGLAAQAAEVEALRAALAELEALRADAETWKALYRRALNAANGLTNYVEDRPELSKIERKLVAIEAAARAALKEQAPNVRAKPTASGGSA